MLAFRGQERLLLIVLAFGAAACGSSQHGETGDPAENLKSFELQEIGHMYKTFHSEKGRPPARLSDLDAYEPLFNNGYQALKSGQCIAVWGIDLKRSDAAQTLLAYRKEVPTQGGWVIMADETVKTVTAEEFKSARKS